MRRIFKALSLLLALTMLASCGSGRSEPEHAASNNTDIPTAPEASAADSVKTSPAEKDSVLPESQLPGYRDQTAALHAYFALSKAFGGEEGHWADAPETYGGCYIDNENLAILTICDTLMTDDLKQTYLDACGTKEIAFRRVTCSYRDLMNAMEAIRDYNDSHDEPLCYGYGLDEMHNCVPIFVTADKAADAEKLRSAHPCIKVTLDEMVLTPSKYNAWETDSRIVLTMDFSAFSPGVDRICGTIYNGWDKPLNYSDFVLETQVDGEWYTVSYKAGIAFSEVLRAVEPGGTLEISCWMSMFNTEYAPGVYRLCLPYCSNFSPVSGRDWDHAAFAGFLISE